MYERFTDRARKVLQLANQEAQRFNHEYIGTEHILFGLIKEGSGVAATVLKNLGVDLRKIRLEVNKLVQSGPEMDTMGKLPHVVREFVVGLLLPLTPLAKKVIEYSIEEADKLNHKHVGTEHILLGLLREQTSVAVNVLMNLGVKLEKVREEVLNVLGLVTATRNVLWRVTAAERNDLIFAATMPDAVAHFCKKNMGYMAVSVTRLSDAEGRLLTEEE